jgi:Periviscerokinin family
VISMRDLTRYLTRGSLAVIAIGLGGLLSACGENAASTKAAPTEVPTLLVAGLHPTYRDFTDLRSASGLIAFGRVTSSSVLEPPALSPDPDGVPVKGLPFTVYAVTVDKVVKGSPDIAGRSIDVAVVGGATEQAMYIVEGATPLAQGSSYLFFLSAGTDGRYYPLAGDRAVATRSPSGDYALPGEVVGESAFTIAAALIDGPTTGSTAIAPEIVVSVGVKVPACARRLSRQACRAFRARPAAWKVIRGTATGLATVGVSVVLSRPGGRCLALKKGRLSPVGSCANGRKAVTRVAVKGGRWAVAVKGIRPGLLRVTVMGGGKTATVSQRLALR